MPHTRELFGDMLFFLVYLDWTPRVKGSLCSWSGEGGRGGVKRLGLRLCWGEVGGESGRGYWETTGNRDGRCGGEVKLGRLIVGGEVVELFRDGVGEGSHDPEPPCLLLEGSMTPPPGPAPRHGWLTLAPLTGCRATMGPRGRWHGEE